MFLSKPTGDFCIQVQKKHKSWPIWQDRYLVVKGPEISYYEQIDDASYRLCKSHSLRGAAVEKATFGLLSSSEGFILKFATGDSISFRCSSDAEISSCIAAIGTGSRVALMSSAVVPNCGNKLISESSLVSTDSTAAPAVTDDIKFPPYLCIDGSAIVDNELHVRSTLEMEALNIAWLRVPESSLSSLKSLYFNEDVTTVSGFQNIPLAIHQIYRISSSDVGYILGARIHPTVGAGSRFAFLNKAVVPATKPLQNAASPLSHRAALTMCPHKHHKYCDRRVRVCTAIGRHREGEVISASVLAAPSSSVEDVELVWYRSSEVYSTVLMGAESSWKSQRESVLCPWNLPPAESVDSHDSKKLVPSAPTAPPSLPPADPNTINKVPKLTSKVRFNRVVPRPISALPPTPDDASPSPSMATVLPYLAPPASLFHVPTDIPSQNDTLTRVLNPNSPQYPLFAEDVGCLLFVLLVKKGSQAPSSVSVLPFRTEGWRPTNDDVTFSGVGSEKDVDNIVFCSDIVGPVEPGPPRAREIWVTGETKVGSTLQSSVYYFGGFEGKSEISWVAIDPQGETKVIKEPVCVIDDSGNKRSDLFQLELTEDLIGCDIKCKYKPVRSDGLEGHQESSRPTKEIIA